RYFHSIGRAEPRGLHPARGSSFHHRAGAGRLLGFERRIQGGYSRERPLPGCQCLTEPMNMNTAAIAASTAEVSPLPDMRIDGQRLWDALMELAQIGATKKGGVCRLAL